MANSRTSRSGEHTRPHYSGILSPRFVIYNRTFGTDNLRQTCTGGVLPLVATACITKDFKLLYSKVAYAPLWWTCSLALLRYQYLCRLTSVSAHMPFLSITNLKFPIFVLAVNNFWFANLSWLLIMPPTWKKTNATRRYYSIFCKTLLVMTRR